MFLDISCSRTKLQSNHRIPESRQGQTFDQLRKARRNETIVARNRGTGLIWENQDREMLSESEKC